MTQAKIGWGNTLQAKIADLTDEGYLFISDSQEVEIVKEGARSMPACAPDGWQECGVTLVSPDDFESFFVRLGEGEYLEVWGVYSKVPYLNNYAMRVR